MISRLLILTLLMTANLVADQSINSNSAITARVLDNNTCKTCGGGNQKKPNKPRTIYSPQVKAKPVKK